MKKMLCGSIVWLTIGSRAWASAGTASADFLKLGVGARYLAMGETGVTTADDVTALYWNPAQLAQISGGSLSLMYVSYVESTQYQYAGYAQSGPWGSLGASLQNFSIGSIARTDDTGKPIGDFSPSDLAATIGWGHSFFNDWRFGTNVKYIRSQITETASTFATDIGVAYEKGPWGAAFALENMGGRLTYIQDSNALPFIKRLGVAYRIGLLTQIAVERDFYNDAPDILGLGVEQIVVTDSKWSAAFRAGYNTRSHNVPGMQGLSLGVGGTWSFIDLDYAWVPLGELGQTHRISLTVRFETPEPQGPRQSPVLLSDPNSVVQPLPWEDP